MQTTTSSRASQQKHKTSFKTKQSKKFTKTRNGKTSTHRLLYASTRNPPTNSRLHLSRPAPERPCSQSSSPSHQLLIRIRFASSNISPAHSQLGHSPSPSSRVHRPRPPLLTQTTLKRNRKKSMRQRERYILWGSFSTRLSVTSTLIFSLVKLLSTLTSHLSPYQRI